MEKPSVEKPQTPEERARQERTNAENFLALIKTDPADLKEVLRVDRFNQAVYDLAKVVHGSEKAYDEIDKITVAVATTSSEEALNALEVKMNKAISEGAYDAAVKLARVLGMETKAKEIIRKQFDRDYAEFQKTAKDRRSELAMRIIDSYVFRGVDDEPRFKELRHFVAVSEIEKAYGNRKKEKTGAAFQEALHHINNPETMKAIEEAAPRAAESIRKDAIRTLELLQEKGRGWRHELTNRFQAYIDRGILDFEKDEELIDRLTAREDKNS